MAESKTKPTGASVDDYIAARATPQQQADCRELMALLERVTGHAPHMWGPSIVGFGSYRYTYVGRCSSSSSSDRSRTSGGATRRMRDPRGCG